MPYVFIILLFFAVITWALFWLYNKRRERNRKKIIGYLASIAPDIEDALADICSLFSYSHYITESERLSIEEKYFDLFKKVAVIKKSSVVDEFPHKESIQRFYKAIGGTIGFPSQISDSPVLKYVLSEPDAYAFSEERRVFYVGITRAKKHTWVLYDMNNPSPFVKEFVKTLEPETKPGACIPATELCPKCHCGRIKVVKKGVAVNGNPYTTFACSNEKYGCDYLETKFVNLNSTHRSSKK